MREEKKALIPAFSRMREKEEWCVHSVGPLPLAGEGWVRAFFFFGSAS